MATVLENLKVLTDCNTFADDGVEGAARELCEHFDLDFDEFEDYDTLWTRVSQEVRKEWDVVLYLNDGMINGEIVHGPFARLVWCDGQGGIAYDFDQIEIEQIGNDLSDFTGWKNEEEGEG